MSTTTSTTIYRIGVPIAHRWATGTIRSTGVRYVEVAEQPTVLGGMRAIEEACRQVGDRALEDGSSPTIEPNPSELDWPVGA